MKTEVRIRYLSFLIVGTIFIIVGIALKELDLVKATYSYSADQLYIFLLPWVGAKGNGIPTPW